MTTGNNNKRIASIDMIKLAAMLGVIAQHIGHNYQYPADGSDTVNQLLAATGSVAMGLFFMVNGFLMTKRQIDYKYVTHKILHIIRFVCTICIIYWLICDVIIDNNYNWKILPGMMVYCFLDRTELSVFWFFGAMIILYLLMPVVNKLTDRHRGFLPSMLVIMTAACFIVYEMNVKWQFEQHILMMFRIWDWLFYFLIGAAIRRYNMSELPKLNIGIASVVAVMLAYLAWAMLLSITGHNEFGSTLFILYSVIVFLYFTQHIKKAKRLQHASELFLPVYAFHIMIINIYHQNFSTAFLGSLSPVADYIIICTVLIAGSHYLMKLPGMKQIFKI